MRSNEIKSYCNKKSYSSLKILWVMFPALYFDFLFCQWMSFFSPFDKIRLYKKEWFFHQKSYFLRSCHTDKYICRTPWSMQIYFFYIQCSTIASLYTLFRVIELWFVFYAGFIFLRLHNYTKWEQIFDPPEPARA